MTDFKRPNRLRMAAQPLLRSIRQARSSCLKGWSFVQRKTQPIAGPLTRRPRMTLIVAGSAIVVIAGVLVGTQQYVQAHTNSYYKVMLNGEPIGEISSKELVENAIETKKQKLAETEASTSIHYELENADVTYEDVSAYKKAPDDEATLKSLWSELKSHPVGVELVVDGKKVAVVKSQQEADEVLQRIKDKFVPSAGAEAKPKVQALSYSASKTAAAQPTRVVKSVAFQEDVTTVPVEIDPSELNTLANPDKLFSALTTGDPKKKTYTVQKGDCIGCIAQKLNISSSVILANNPWIQDDEIKVGDVLDVTQTNPLLHVESEEEVTQIEVIDPPVEIRKSDDMKVGQTKTLREGQNGQRQVTYRLVKNNGTMIEEEQIASKVLKPAVSKIILKGTKVIPSEGTGKFAWPVSNHRITSYMGERWGRMHKGIDIVGNRTIMAADNGTVEFVGQKTGYGNVIIINHHNGFETLYGHLKSFSVKKGQVVSKGDALGIMGATGDATGVHLHFEIHLDGKLRNPTSYL